MRRTAGILSNLYDLVTRNIYPQRRVMTTFWYDSPLGHENRESSDILDLRLVTVL